MQFNLIKDQHVMAFSDSDLNVPYVRTPRGLVSVDEQQYVKIARTIRID